MQEELRDYIENYRYRTDPRAIFTKRTGRLSMALTRFNYNRLRGLIKYIGTKAETPQLHPHSLRHYYATSLWKAGVDISEVQILVDMPASMRQRGTPTSHRGNLARKSGTRWRRCFPFAKN